MARSLPGVEIDHPPDGAYERALAGLSAELASVGLLELNVWRGGGAAVCSLDRAVGGQVVRDVCDAATAGRPEGATMRQRRTHVDAEIVAAPILFEQRVLGALSARFDSRSAATAAQSQVEQGAERLAALLEVGRLSRRNAALSQDWETVVSALQSIAGGNDLHTICDAARRHVSEAIDFEAFLVARTLAESGELEVFYLYEDGLPREVSFRYALAKESPGTTVALSGRPLIFRHTAEWGRFGAKPLDDDAPPGDLPASAMFLPLASGSKVLGVLSLQSTRPGTFGEREHALLEPIAEGLAMAIARSHFQHVSEDARIERRVILDVARALARDPHLPHVLEELCRQAQQVVDSPDVWVAMADRDGEQLAIAHHVRAGRSLPVGEAEVSAARTQRVFRGGRPLICNTRQEIEAAGIGADECPQARSLAIVPLRAGTKTVGAMHCCSPREHAYPASRADLLVAIGEQAGIAVTNARMYEDAAERSNRDPLTELLTHRAIMLGLQRLLTEQRAGVAAILLDIEAFRLFNTTFGHHIGDEALRLMTRCIRSAMGERDLAARYGGDEFLVVLAHGGAPAAHAFLERLREELLRTPLDSPGGVPIPISFSSGVAAAPEDGTSREALVAAADDRLQAERAGVLPQLTPATGRNCPALTPVQDGLLVAILRKDLYTRAHIHYVGEMAMDFAAALSLDAQTTHALFLATLLHDVGKICIPDAIISKPSTLTPSERKVMQRHTMLGYELVRGIDGMEIASLAVLHHHERIDGHGYPFGLAGNAIPEIARMVTIIDAFSAMVLDRPYHKAISDDAAKAELRRCAGTQFDAAYVEAFCRLLEG